MNFWVYAITILFIGSASFAENEFGMKVDGILGEFTGEGEFPKEEGWIKVFAFTYDMGNEDISKPLNGIFKVYIEPDKSRIPLLLATMKKSQINEIVIKIPKTSTFLGISNPFGFIIHLKSAQILKIRSFGKHDTVSSWDNWGKRYYNNLMTFQESDETNSLPIDANLFDEIIFTFKQIEWEVPETQGQPAVMGGWDLVNNKEITNIQSAVGNFGQHDASNEQD